MDQESNHPGQSGDMDESLQREIDEALGGKSVEDLLNEADAVPHPRRRRARPIEPGDIVPCRVAALDRQSALVELGGKDQGYVPLEQFDSPLQPGDILQLEVVRYDRQEDLWVLSRKGAVERATWEDLQVGQVVEAFVEKANKGGLEVKFGGISAFMPISHISMYRVEDPAEFVHQKLRCQVIEIDRRDSRVIVSARALMELQAQEKREALLAELAEDDIREGVVRQVMPYGLFVDLGGADGLVHVSQMSYTRVANPADLVQPGQKVTVKVLKIDEAGGKISLSMKQAQPDPWDAVEAKYPPGFLVTGLVTHLADFGAFVEAEPGLEALIPIGEISWTQRLGHPRELLQVGQEVQAVVTQVEPQRRRMTLSLRQAQANPWTGAAQKYPTQSIHPGEVTRIAEFGAFVALEAGVEGLVHVSELSDQHVRQVEQAVQVGQAVEVRVLDVDEPNRRISLSMRGLAPAAGPAGAEVPPSEPKKKRKRPLRGGLD